MLPKAEGHSRVNTVNKFCKHCKKTRHESDDCWSLHGRSTQDKATRRKANVNKTICYNERDKKKNPKRNKKIEDSGASDSDSEGEESTPRTRTAAEYRVTHIKKKTPIGTGLDFVIIPVRVAERGKINFLFDTGAKISFLKLKFFKGTAQIHEEKIKLIGVTGHTISTLGRTYVTIPLRDGAITHPFYVIKDNEVVEYNGILEADFIKRHATTCDYTRNQLQIKGTIFKFRPYQETQ